MEEKNHESRRSFIKKSASATALLTIPSIIPAHAFGANDRINAAVLGLNGRGKDHIKGLMAQKNVQITTFVDPDLNVEKLRATGEYCTGYA
jgi:predicted nucleic acid binding AN1-type Zn finger protein